jgi:hypothetical protein
MRMVSSVAGAAADAFQHCRQGPRQRLNGASRKDRKKVNAGNPSAREAYRHFSLFIDIDDPMLTRNR